MKNDLSFINSEVDLDQAIQLVQQRITDAGIQIKEDVKQVPGVLLKKAVDNSKFFLVGSVSAGLISMVIKKLAFSRKPQPVTKSLPLSLASFALKSWPIASLLVRKLIQHNHTRNTKVS